MDDLPDVDYVEICLEEIALEGMDGITLSALWIRLENRPNFSMTLDEPARNYLWEICARHPDIEAYILAEPRPPLVIYNRFANIDSETGLIIEPGEDFLDIYPLSIVKDANVLGSCSSYYSRTNVTPVLRFSADGRDLILSLKEAEEKWGERLVLVASAERRRRVLLGPEGDPCLQLNQMQYAMLERIGRSRYLGEVTQGRNSLSGLHSCAKTLFYHRKLLLKKGLVTKQLHYQKSINGQLRNGMLLHLTRYYVERKSKIFLMLQEMCRFLQSRPNKTDTVDAVRKHMGIKHKILKQTLRRCLLKLADVKVVPIPEFFPNATKSETYFANGKMRTVRILCLRDNVDPDNLEKVLYDEEGDDDDEGGGDGEGSSPNKKKKKKAADDDEDDNDDDEDENKMMSDTMDSEQSNSGENKLKALNAAILKNGIPDPRNQVIDRPMLHQAYKLFEQLGPKGEDLRKFGILLGVPRLESRAICRNLKRLGVVSTIMRDSGRQRITTFTAKRFTSSSQKHRELYEECQKMLQLTMDTAAKGKSDVPESAIDQTSTDATMMTPAFPPSAMAADISAVTVEHCSTDSMSGVGLKQGRGTIMEDIQKICQSDEGDDSLAITSKILKRANLILQAVRQAKVIDHHVKIQKMILKEEEKEGEHKVDRKSIFRLIKRLAKEGYVKYVHSVLRHGDKEKKIHMVCDPSLQNDDPLILSAIEQAKFKYFALASEPSKNLTREQIKSTAKTKEALKNCPRAVTKSVAELRSLRDKEGLEAPLEYNVRIGKVHGYEPKFIRIKVFHEFLYYLVHGYEGRDDCEIPQDIQALDRNQNLNLPKIYHPDLSWRMFVSPLSSHMGFGRGWCLLSDILLRLPLCLLVKLVNYNFKIEGLSDFLDHPIKRLFPITRLPQRLRNYLLFARKYISATHDIATKLAYMGLLSFGPKDYKDKDQVFMYIHVAAKVVDTTVSRPSYHRTSEDVSYASRQYYFHTMQDVQLYWLDLETVCLNTPLGCYLHDQGKVLTFENIAKKPSLIEALASKTTEEVCDNGSIPGDGRGAGGLDSMFFAHLKRNWSWLSNSDTGLKKGQVEGSRQGAPGGGITANIIKGMMDHKPLSKFITFLCNEGNQIAGPPNVKKRLTRLAINTQLQTMSSENVLKHKKATTKEVTRVRKPRKQTKDKNNLGSEEKGKPSVKQRMCKRNLTRKRRPYYDDLDKAALKRVQKQRVSWSSKEDSMLLLCKVASNLLDPTARFLIVHFTVVRDFLHKHVKESADKTSRAIQRRLNYMLKNPLTVFNVSVFVGESRQDKEIMDLCDLPPMPKTHEEEWQGRFESVMAKLLVKFKVSSSPMTESTGSNVIPNSLEEFHSMFTVTHAEDFLETNFTPVDVKNVVDVHFNVVCTLILSSVASVSDCSNWSYYLYQIYRQYPESLLFSALGRLRSQQILSKRKNCSRHAKKRFLLMTLPYQLSVRYDYLFLCRFREHIFPEANIMMQKLLDDARGEDKGVEVHIDQEGGYAATLLCLAATRKLMFELTVPDEVIILNLDDSKMNKHCATFMKKFQNCEVKKLPPRPPVLHWTGVPRKYKPPAASEKEAKSVRESPGETDSRPPAKRMKLDTMALGDGALQSNKDGQTADDVDPGEAEKNSENLLEVETGSSKIHYPPLTRSSRFALYMMRKEMTETVVDNTQHSQDYLVIKPCTVRCRLHPAIQPLTSCYPVTTERVEKALQWQNVFFPSGDSVTVEDVEQHYLILGYPQEAINEMAQVYEYIIERHELGAKRLELVSWFQNSNDDFQCLSIDRHLDLMTECRLILKVGVATIRYVALVHAKPWLINTYRLAQNGNPSGPTSRRGENGDKPSEGRRGTFTVESSSSIEASLPHITHANESQRTSAINEILGRKHRWRNMPLPNLNDPDRELIRFVCRPWRKPDGTVHYYELRHMLNCILCQIMAMPGMTYQQLCEKYASVLNPVQLLELLNILEEIECVCRRVFKRSHRTTLFSKPATIIPADENDPDASICYEPDVECVIKLAQVVLEDYV